MTVTAAAVFSRKAFLFISLFAFLLWCRVNPGERSLRLPNEFRQESCSVRSDPVPGEDDIRTPLQQSVANHLHDQTRFVRVAPATMEDILILEAEVTRKGDPLAAQLRRV